VQVGYRLNEREAETAAGRGAARLQPVEAPEYFFALRCGNARPGVGDRQYWRARVLSQADADSHPGRTMANGVFDEIGNHLRQKLAVAGDRKIALDTDLQFLALIFGDSGIGFKNRGQDPAKAHIRKRRLAGAGFDLCDSQQSRKRFEYGIQLRNGLFDVPFPVGTQFRPCGFQPVAQAAQRSTQIVGNIVGHPLHALHQSLDSVQHGIQVDRQLIHLVFAAARRHALRKIPLHDRARGSIDRLDAAQESDAERSATACRQQHCDDDAPAERLPYRFTRFTAR
jgi:hypothetical protein